ncbi:hypothetical protein V8E55_005703, partial [Tylopilus felleus]
LNDFICDNLECGTFSMNYFSKLQCIISNVFPHAILVWMPTFLVTMFHSH